MRYRTAAILSVVLIGGMFGLPEAIRAVFLPSLEQGIPAQVPGYERVSSVSLFSASDSGGYSRFRLSQL